MKKSEQLPAPKLAFSKEQVVYIEQASKMMPYNICITSAYIFVPHDMISQAEENLTVQHLRNKFGFILQTTIDNNLKDVFNPVMGNNIDYPQIKNKIDIELPKKGEIWLKGTERLYFSILPKDLYEVTYLGSLKGKSKITRSSVESWVVNGLLIKE